ncbi:MAG: type 1 glutamine amidotransferase [Ostreibacterium sp.]
MKLLIVEGNPKLVWQSREHQGASAYHRRFAELLANLGYHNIEVAFPSESRHLPTNIQLKDFNGVLLTGSILNVYHKLSEVTRQLDFVTRCFATGVPIYGSCWGLQLAVTVAGGKIERCQNGREFGLSKAITLTQAGRNSPFYMGKSGVFDAYCIHEDETVILPKNTEILAKNNHSAVQALTFRYGQSDFFGVQYHPEFFWEDIHFLANLMEEQLTHEGIFTPNCKKTDYLQQMVESSELNQRDNHTLEIANWLRYINTPR